MDPRPISLQEVLDRREQRAHTQQALQAAHPHAAVISFCMNIPGPVKTDSRIAAAFAAGLRALQHALAARGCTVLAEHTVHQPTGDEWLAAVDAPADRVKALATHIEETHPLGRLFDMDVLRSTGEKLCRPQERSCIVCGGPVRACARSRAHTVEQLQAAVYACIAAFSTESMNK